MKLSSMHFTNTYRDFQLKFMEYILSKGGACVGLVLIGVQLNSIINNQDINIIIYIIKTKICCNY